MASSAAALRLDLETFDLETAELAAVTLEADEPPPSEAHDPDALSWNELCARYPGQWVVLANISPSFTGDLAQLRGKLIDHQPTRRATDSAVRTARPHHENVESFWTGDPEAQLPWPSL